MRSGFVAGEVLPAVWRKQIKQGEPGFLIHVFGEQWAARALLPCRAGTLALLGRVASAPREEMLGEQQREEKQSRA